MSEKVSLHGITVNNQCIEVITPLSPLLLYNRP